MARVVALALVLVLVLHLGAVAAAAGVELPRFEAQVPDPEPFTRAWQRTPSPVLPTPGFVSGITVPHHLAAADLIALGFRAAALSAEKPKRVIVLAPDHYKRSGRPFATSARDHDTALGPVAVDRGAVARLLKLPLVEASDLLGREHGIGAVLPFVRLAFPGVPVVPITVSINSRRRHWDALAALLHTVADSRTLIVQSTDFSHYLNQADAAREDQRSLNTMASGDADALALLHQPRQVDSAGAAYVQARFQQQRHGAAPVVLANLNSAEIGATDALNTTSYAVLLYAHGLAQRVVLPPQAGARTLCLVGDTFFGRHVQRWLQRPAVRQRVFDAWRERLAGCPLVVNLEGVLTDGPADGHAWSGSGPPRLRMPVAETLQALRVLNVVAAGVANNHSLDFGEAAYRQMLGHLQGAGIAALEHGQVQRVNGLRLIALRDFDNPPRGGRALIDTAALHNVEAAAQEPGPLLAFVHWGQEFQATPGERERRLAQQLAAAGAGWVVGAHPHRASAGLAVLGKRNALLAYSLGNFAFDMPAPPASGAVLQLSCFAQGTCATRQIVMPGIFELGRR